MAKCIALLVALAIIGGLGYALLSAKPGKSEQTVNAGDVINESANDVGGHDNMTVRVKVDFIEFEAVVITEANYEELNEEWGGQLTAYTDKTSILLGLSNHRQNLEEYDYKELAVLDGQQAEEWTLFSSTMGGYHVDGLLIFPAVNDPQDLIIGGLPVGEVTLSFNRNSDET